MKKIFTLLIVGLLFVPLSLRADNWTETFDDQTANTYGTSFTCTISGTWTASAAGNFVYANTNMGSPAATINDDNAGAHITTPVLNTCGTVSFKYAYINGNETNVFVLQVSTDGITFNDLDTHTLGAESNLTYVSYTFDVNESSSTVYIRVLSDNQNAHLFIEDFTVTDYTGGPDTDAPVWDADYPKAGNIEDVQFDLLAKLDETSTVYYVVLDNNATAPTVEEVKAGTGSAGAAAVVAGSFTAGTSEATQTVTGLVVETDYDVYVVAEDDEATPNVQAAVSLVEITTVVMPDVLALVDFESALDPWSELNFAGEKIWKQTSGYAEANGYGSAGAEVDWLISPQYDLTGVTSPQVALSIYWRYGTNDDTHFMKFKYSTDWDGDSVNLVTATWTEIALPLPTENTWADVDPIDISAITGTVYFAFEYNYPDNYSRWRVDNFKLLGFAPAGTDASLSDLQVDGTTISGFDAAKTSYTMELAAGTTTVPSVTVTTKDENAGYNITPATDLNGDEAARTTSVLVTAQDGTTTQTYTVLFNPIIEVADIAGLRAATDFDRKYKLAGEAVLTQKDSYRNKKYIEDASGAIEIDDSDGIITTTYAIGDGITGVTGKLGDYYGLLQLTPTEDPGAATTTGNAVEPQVISVSEFVSNFESYEAEFVKIEGVTFDNAGSTFEDGKNYIVRDGGDSTVFRTAFYGVLSSTIPVMADIQGVAVWHFSEAKVAPRLATDITAYSSDASLSDLLVDGTTIEGFAAGTYSYAMELPYGTTVVPTVTYAVNDAAATASVSNASDLAGDEAARTTTVDVTAQDGTTAAYSIVFSVSTIGVEKNNLDAIRVYPVPANSEITISGLSGTAKIINLLGSTVKTVEITSDKMQVDISDLNEGIYLISSGEVILKFVKK